MKTLDSEFLYWFAIGSILLAVLAVFLLFTQGSGVHRIVDNGDAYLHTWNLWWVQTAIDEGRSPYFTDYNAFPDGVSLTFHQFIFPLGILSYPLFKVGITAGEVLVFWQYLFAYLGFSGMFLLVYRFTEAPMSSTVAGLHYVLLPIYWQNLPRPDSLTYLLFPWIVLSVVWSRDGHWSRLSVPLILSCFLFLMSPYFAAGLSLLWLLAIPFTARLHLNRLRLILLGILTFFLTSFHWVRQVIGTHPNLSSWRIIEGFSADLTAWFLPPKKLWWLPAKFAWWTDLWTALEPSLYPGLIAMLLVIIGAIKYQTSSVNWMLGVCGVFFLVALGPGITILGETFASGFLPYGWGIQLFSSLRAFRAPLRFGIFVLFFLSFGVGYYFPRRGFLRYGLAIVLLGELVAMPVYTTNLPDRRSLKRVKKVVEAPALVPVPVTSWPTEVQYAQTIHEKKLPLVGISHAPESVWKVINRNPVLKSLYQREKLPETGWDQLKKAGYGGVIFHQRLFPEELKKRKDTWIKTLKDRFGAPAIRSRRFLLFTFD